MKCYACDSKATGGVFRLDGSSYRFAVRGSMLAPACKRHAAFGRKPVTRERVTRWKDCGVAVVRVLA
jgi:hypothetical protein